MKSDIELYKHYFSDDSYTSRSRLSSKFEGVARITENGSIDILDVSSCRAMFNEIFDYFVIRQKFMALEKQAMGHLSFTDDGFKLYETTFKTLDEVEKALRNKAFL